MPPANNTVGKLPGRQTNNSLSSLTGNIFIPPTGGGGAVPGATTASGSSGSTMPVKAATETVSRSKQTKDYTNQRKKKSKSSEV